jgi:hypothetical protein
MWLAEKFNLHPLVLVESKSLGIQDNRALEVWMQFQSRYSRMLFAQDSRSRRIVRRHRSYLISHRLISRLLSHLDRLSWNLIRRPLPLIRRNGMGLAEEVVICLDSCSVPCLQEIQKHPTAEEKSTSKRRSPNMGPFLLPSFLLFKTWIADFSCRGLYKIRGERNNTSQTAATLLPHPSTQMAELGNT